MNNNDSDDDSDQQHQILIMEEQAAAAAIATATATAGKKRRTRIELISLLQQHDEFYLRARNKIDDLAEEFLEKMEDDIHNMLCEDNIENNYNGLDDSRDTENEVETAIRFFPAVLSKRKAGRWREANDDDDDYDDDDEEEEEEWIDGEYPIQCLALFYNKGDSVACNLKAVSFVPLVARITIELGLFEEQERGCCLVCEDRNGNNVLQNLVRNDYVYTVYSRKLHESVDDKYLQVLKKLREMGILKKEDIQRHQLLKTSCWQSSGFAEKRFGFLAEWDPSALFYGPAGNIGALPLHCSINNSSSIRGFRIVFKYGIRYFPKKKGISLLFKKLRFNGETPFQEACNIYGRDEVMKVIEDTLIHYSDTPINVAEALLMAAIDENVHLDCVYFLLRRQPEVLVNLRSSTPTAAAATASMAESNNKNNDVDVDGDVDGDGDGDGDGENGGNSNTLVVKMTLDSSKKRKR